MSSACHNQLDIGCDPLLEFKVSDMAELLPKVSIPSLLCFLWKGLLLLWANSFRITVVIKLGLLTVMKRASFKRHLCLNTFFMPLLPHSEEIDSKIIINGEGCSVEMYKTNSLSIGYKPKFKRYHQMLLVSQKKHLKLWLMKKGNKISYDFIYWWSKEYET